MPDFSLVDQMPPFPECLQRAFILQSRRVSPVLPPPLITAPGKESFQKTDRLLCVREPEETFHRVPLSALAKPGIISQMQLEKPWGWHALTCPNSPASHPVCLGFLGCSVFAEAGRHRDTLPPGDSAPVEAASLRLP